MPSYQPAALSFFSRIFLNPAVHIGSIVILVIIAILYIKGQQRRTALLDQHLQTERLSRGPVIIDRDEATSAKLVPQSSGEQAQAEATSARATAPPAPTPTLPPPPPLPAATVARSTESNFLPPPPALPAASPSLAARSLNKNAFKVRVLLAEVETSTLDRWAMKMQAGGQYDAQSDFRMGALANIQKEVDSDRSIVIYETQERSFDSSPNIELVHGRMNGDQVVGFKTSLSLAAAEKEAPQVEVRVMRTLEPTDPRTFEAEFEVPNRGGWLFSNILSHQYRPYTEDEMNPKSFFQILSSDRFKKLRTQFTMIFVFDRPNGK